MTTSGASSIGSTSATLNGRVDPNGRSTTYFFDYGTTTAYGSKTSSSSAGSGSSSTSVSKSVTGLKPGTTYHFRLVATSDAGTVAGADQVFTTQSAPTVTTGSATAIGPTSAALGGTVNPNGRSTSWYVEYGTSSDVRVEELVAQCGLGHDLAGGRRHRLESPARCDLPLPARRDELAGDDPGRRRDLRHDRGAAGGNRSGELRDAFALVRARQRHRQSARSRNSLVVRIRAHSRLRIPHRRDTGHRVCGHSGQRPARRVSRPELAGTTGSWPGARAERPQVQTPRSPLRHDPSTPRGGPCAARSSEPRRPMCSAERGGAT